MPADDRSPAVDVTLAGRSVPGLRAPLLSVVVVNHDYGRFVGETIDSIKAQDYGPMECVIVDNGSTDNSLHVIRDHVGSDARFDVLPLPSNIGQLAGALRGLRETSGQFVAFVDADDVLLPSFASTHIQAHLAVPTNVGVTSSGLLEVDREGRSLSSSHAGLQLARTSGVTGLRDLQDVVRLATIDDDRFEHVLSRRTVTVPASVDAWIWAPGTSNVLRRSVVDLLVEGMSEPGNRSADSFFLPLCHAFAGTALIDVPLTIYRLHGTNFFSAREMIAGLRNSTAEYVETHGSDQYENVEVVLRQAERFRWLLGVRRFWEVVDQATCCEGDVLPFYRTDDAEDVFTRTAATTIAAVGPAAYVAAVRGRFTGRRARAIVRAAYGGRLPWRARCLLLALSWRGAWTALRTAPRWVGRLGWAVRGGRGPEVRIGS